DASRSAKTLPPTPLYRHQKNKCDSHSHSCSSSPRCSSSEDIGDKSSSRSHSRSYSPRHHRSSRDGSRRSSSSSCSRSWHHSSRDEKHKSTSDVHLYTPHRSRSRHKRNRSSNSSSAHSGSPSHHRSRDKRNRSNSSSCQRRLQLCISRSRSRSCSPYYDRSALSCYRARSGSSEKLSSPKRMCKKSRNHEQQLSRGRSPERRLSPRSDQKQWSPKKSLERESFLRKTDNKRLSPIGIHIRQSSPRKIDNKRWSPMTGWKKQMSLRRTNDEQWSPKRSLERESSPRKTDGKQWSPKRSLERESSPRKTDDKQLSPIRIRICQSSPRMIDDKRCSSMSGWKKQMSLRRTHDRQWSPKRSLERESSPRKTDDNQLSPIRIHIRQLSPRMIDNQRWSPTTGWKKQMSSRRTDDKRWSPTRSHERLSSPIRSHNKRYSPTRNHEQHSSPRGTDGKSWSPMRVRVRQSSPKITDDKQWSLLRRTDEKLWSPMRSHEHQSSPGRTNDKQGSPAQSSEYRRRPGDKPWLPDKSHRQQSFPGRDEEHFVPMQSDEEMSSLRRKRKRHASLEELSSQKNKSCSIQMLTKRLLKKSAVQSASRQSNIANVVNLVVPVLLSELAKTQESSPSLVLPSQAKNRKVLNFSSSGSKSCSSSQSNLPKLEWNPARSSKKLKDNTSKRALSIITEDWRKHHRVKATDGNELGSCENLDLLPIKTLLSLHQKLTKPLLGTVVTTLDPLQAQEIIKTHETSVKALPKDQPRMIPNADSKKSKSLGKNPDSGGTIEKLAANPSRKDKDSEVAAKDTTKVGKMLQRTVAEANKGKEIITEVKISASKTSADKKLNKTAKCSGVAKQMNIKESVGDKLPFSNDPPRQPKTTKPLLSKVVTTLDPLQAQEIIKTHETSVKALPKDQPRMAPNADSNKSKSLRKNPDSGGTIEKLAANPSRKDKDSEVAAKDTTKVGKMLQRTVAESSKGKEMVTKVKVNASKASADTKLDKAAKCSPEDKLTETNTFAIHTKNIHQPKSKETTPGFSIITSALPMIENSPDGFWPAKHGFSDEVTTTAASLSKPEHPQPVINVATTPDKLADPTQTQQTTMKTPETLVQQKMVLHPDLAALNPKTNDKQLQVQPQSVGSSANALLGAVQNTGQEEGKICQKGMFEMIGTFSFLAA
ncbi:hypothetical protein ILYODFUR_016882, partial [Ilyodon furcidens]